jgi:hypothetical protein
MATTVGMNPGWEKAHRVWQTKTKKQTTMTSMVREASTSQHLSLYSCRMHDFAVETLSQDEEADEPFDITLQVEENNVLREVIIDSDVSFDRFRRRIAGIMKEEPNDVELAWSCNLTPVKQWATPRVIDGAAALRKLIELAEKVVSGAQKVPKGKSFEIKIHNLNAGAKGTGKKGAGKEKDRISAMALYGKLC